jgi:hypothetical protein
MVLYVVFSILENRLDGKFPKYNMHFQNLFSPISS